MLLEKCWQLFILKSASLRLSKSFVLREERRGIKTALLLSLIFFVSHSLSLKMFEQQAEARYARPMLTSQCSFGENPPLQLDKQ